MTVLNWVTKFLKWDEKNSKSCQIKDNDKLSKINQQNFKDIKELKNQANECLQQNDITNFQLQSIKKKFKRLHLV